MGSVYLARDLELERQVALKLISRELTEGSTGIDRLKREARAAARLNHENVVVLHGLEEQGGQRFLIMEYVEGQSLRERLADGKLGSDEFWRLAVALSSALTAAHRAGVVHRDLKPENVITAASGTIKVLDFGLARLNRPSQAVAGAAANEDVTLDEHDDARDTEEAPQRTRPGTLLGTPAYMSPEQLRSEPAGPASDVFALAVVLIESLTGTHPFAGETPVDQMANILQREPTGLGPCQALHSELGPLLERCLAKDPARRDPMALVHHEFEAMRSRLPLASSRAPAFVHRSPLAGREKELDVLETALERASGGQRQTVLLAGEPGIGKTRLTEELEARARQRGFVVLRGHCFDTAGQRAFGPWAQMLERALAVSDPALLAELLGPGARDLSRILPALRLTYPDLPPPTPVPPELEREHLLECYARLVRNSATRQAQCLIIEDLHWADDASLALLQHLLQRLEPELPLMLLGTYRDTDLTTERPFAAALSTLRRTTGFDRLALHRLSRDQVREYLEARVGGEAPASIVGALYEGTEGNPFFLQEVYEHLDSHAALRDADGAWHLSGEDAIEVPEGVRLAVERRLEVLTEDALDTLRCAAVLGRAFDFGELERAESLRRQAGPADARETPVLETIEAAEVAHLIELVRSAGSTRRVAYRFSHELVRQTLLEQLSIPRRQRLHLAIARGLQELAARVDGAVGEAGPEGNSEAIAHHLYLAGAAAGEAETEQYLALAADLAQRSGDPEGALHWAKCAQELQRTTTQRVSWALKETAALEQLGRQEEGFERAARGFELAATGSEADLEALDLAYALVFGHSATATGRHLDWVEIVGRHRPDLWPPEHKTRSYWIGLLELHAAFGADFETAELWSARRAAGERTMAQELRMIEIWVHQAAGNVTAMAERLEESSLHEAAPQESESIKQSLVAKHRSLYDDLGPRMIQGWIGSFGGKAGNWRQRWAELQDAAEARDLVFLDEACYQPWFRAPAWTERGDATVLLEPPSYPNDLPKLSRFKRWTVPACYAKFLLGDWDGVRQDLVEEPWSPQHMAEIFETASLPPLALTAFVDPPSDPMAWWHSVRPQLRLETAQRGFSHWFRLIAVVEPLVHLGLREQAGSLYRYLTQALDNGLRVDLWQLTEKVAGIAASAAKRYDDAEGHFAAALEEAERLPLRNEEAEVRRFWAAMLLDRALPGDLTRARELLRLTRALYEQLGRPKHLEMLAMLEQRAL